MPNSARSLAAVKRYEAHLTQNFGLRGAWHAKQLEYSGTELPATFPALSKLHFPPAFNLQAEEKIAGLEWFTAYEDLSGATVEFLLRLGLNTGEATAVCAEIE